MKRLVVDMDGVLADCFEQFIRFEEAETGIVKSISDGIGKKEEETFPNARKYLYQTGFFRNMRVIADSQEVLRKLNDQYEVFIVSAATEFPQSLAEKQDWLNEHFSFISWEQMVFCGKKTMIKADIMIDDHFRNLDHFEGRTLLFTQPHNQLTNPGRHRRVHSWKEIEQLLSGAGYRDTFNTLNDLTPIISKYF